MKVNFQLVLGVKRAIGLSLPNMLVQGYKIDGGELRIINDDEVLAVVDDPRDILPPNLI